MQVRILVSIATSSRPSKKPVASSSSPRFAGGMAGAPLIVSETMYLVCSKVQAAEPRPVAVTRLNWAADAERLCRTQMTTHFVKRHDHAEL